MSYDDDDHLYDLDTVGPNEADIQMAQWAAEADRLQAIRSKGVCTHSSSVGVSASGQIYRPEQETLKPGQVACTEHTGDCNMVFDSRDAWHAAHVAF